MRRLVHRILILSVVAGLLAGLAPAVVLAAPTAHDRTIAYWTAERMAAAVPRDFTRVGDRFVLAGKPPKPSSDIVTGATWTGGGAALRATGRVSFTMGGSAWICSGAVIADATGGRSLVLTAAHCAFDEATGEFADLWMFIPEFATGPTYTCSDTKWGCWTATALVVDSGYADAGDFNVQAVTHDWAVAVVGPGGKTAADLEATVGAFAVGFPALETGARAYAFGYPAAGRYKGATLTYCAGPTFADLRTSSKTWGLTCSMTGGSSGGPWFGSFNEASASGTIGSLNSYRYSDLKAMFGPQFGSATQAVVTAARSATSDRIVTVP